jgi:hypothetical protein
MALDVDQRVFGKRGADGCREGLAVDRERAPGRDLVGVGGAQDQGAQAPHFLVQETNGTVLFVVGTQRVRAYELGERIRLVRRCLPYRAHFMQSDCNTASGELPGGLTTCKSAADDVHWLEIRAAHERKLGALIPK